MRTDRFVGLRLPMISGNLALFTWLVAVVGSVNLFAQSPPSSPFTGVESLFTPPRQYQAHLARQAPKIDGELNDPAWQSAPWSDLFVDIEGDTRPLPSLATRMKMVWTDSCLFIAADMKEPHVWATLKQHDDIIYHDNDFEVFIDPDNNTHQYYELEINALNTIFDLFMAKPYRNGGQAMLHWNLVKLRSAVRVQGTLNNPRDTDNGWTIEMAIPFQSLSLGNDTQVPKEGDVWRINFSRVQWDTDAKEGKYVKKKAADGRNLPEHNWVWSPQGLVNMHFPERWGYLQFSRRQASTQAKAFELSYAEKQKRYLWLGYYRQKEYLQKHGYYAASLADIELDASPILLDELSNQLRLEASKHQFMFFIESPSHTTWSINQDGFIQAHSQTP